MPPRVKRSEKPTPTGQKQPTKEMAATRGSAKPTPGRQRKVDKSRTKGKKIKQKIKLKGWLATPADWARFNAWAKEHAQPRKLPEPPAIVRPSKPLSQLKRRIRILSQPRETPDPKIHCRLDLSISKAALNATASLRTILLSLPIVRLLDYGRVYYKVSPAALTYAPSQRILELSQPKRLGSSFPEGSDPCAVSARGGRGVDEERLEMLSSAKSLYGRGPHLTPDEMAKLFTPWGVRRSALTYKITPWVMYLSLPAYKAIKDRKDKTAITWKKTIVEEGEERGKIALSEYMGEDEETKRGKKRKYEDTDDGKAGAAGDTADEGEGSETKEKAEKAKRRKIEKHAWRFAPRPIKDDPYRIKRAALKAKASPRIEKLAEGRIAKDTVTRKDAFTVKKGALSASPSARVEILAKPTAPRSPVERRPPREKDKYGRPIFEIPVYEKVLPKTKPYRMGDCPPVEKKKVAKKRPIDPIVFEPTIDPCIWPGLAKRQKLERQRAETMMLKKGKKRRKQKTRLKRSKYPEKTNAEDEGNEEGAGEKEVEVGKDAEAENDAEVENE